MRDVFQQESSQPSILPSHHFWWVVNNKSHKNEHNNIVSLIQLCNSDIQNFRCNYMNMDVIERYVLVPKENFQCLLVRRQDGSECMREMCSKKVLFIASKCETYEGAQSLDCWAAHTHCLYGRLVSCGPSLLGLGLSVY